MDAQFHLDSHPKLCKGHNGLYHHVCLIEMVRKHTWIILVGARMKKTVFWMADPAETGLAGSQN
jgi:hypothetical protein